MNLFDFMHAHIFVTWLLAWGVIPVAFFLSVMVLRTIKVCVRGWPPAHLDADGDFLSAPKAAP